MLVGVVDIFARAVSFLHLPCKNRSIKLLITQQKNTKYVVIIMDIGFLCLPVMLW